MREHNTLVFDLGGTNLKITVMTIEDDIFEVLSTNVGTHLGGEDFNNHLMNYFVYEFEFKYKRTFKNEKLIGLVFSLCMLLGNQVAERTK